MSGHHLSVLMTPTTGEAMETLEWLNDREPLPRLLATFRVSLEFSVGRVSVVEVIADRQRGKDEAGDA